MSRPADLPMAQVRYTALKRGGDQRCEVIVNGTPVALLPTYGVDLVAEASMTPYVKIRIPLENLDLATLSLPQTAGVK